MLRINNTEPRNFLQYSQVRQVDAGGKDWKRNLVQKCVSRDLDPGIKYYKYPDFGFDYTLQHTYSSKNVWEFLFDIISKQPKYERLKNKLEELTDEKLIYLKKQINSKQSKLINENSKTEFKLRNYIPRESITNRKVEDFLKQKQAMRLQQQRSEKRVSVKEEDKQYNALEQAFTLEETFINPITKRQGQKASGDKMKRLWLDLQNLILTNKENQKKFDLIKLHCDKNVLEEFITNIYSTLEQPHQDHQCQTFEGEHQKLEKLLVKKQSLESLIKNYTPPQEMLKVKSRQSCKIDHKLDSQYMPGNTQKDFIKLNLKNRKIIASRNHDLNTAQTNPIQEYGSDLPLLPSLNMSLRNSTPNMFHRKNRDFVERLNLKNLRSSQSTTSTSRKTSSKRKHFDLRTSHETSVYSRSLSRPVYSRPRSLSQLREEARKTKPNIVLEEFGKLKFKKSLFMRRNVIQASASQV